MEPNHLCFIKAENGVYFKLTDKTHNTLLGVVRFPCMQMKDTDFLFRRESAAAQPCIWHRVQPNRARPTFDMAKEKGPKGATTAGVPAKMVCCLRTVLPKGAL